MRRTIHLIIILLALALRAGVPIRWTADTSRVQPHVLEAWRGDTLELECTLVSYGQRVAPGAATASFLWQTNGMGTAWWQTNATISADGVIAATWSPSMDPGGAEVAFFMPVVAGDGASYRAAGRIRFRPSPGAGSRTVELPQPGGTLDFGDFQLVNAPWATLAAANEAIAAAVTSATGALVIPPAVDLGPYATTGYVAGAVTSATGALVIPPPADLTPYATTGAVAHAVQTASSALADALNVASNAAMPRAEMGEYATTQAVADAILNISIPSLAGYATEAYVADFFATNYTPPDLSSYASRSYVDEAASNAQATAIAAIPSLAGYATEAYVADFFATNYTPPDLSSYASRYYADEAASNAQATAIAAIPSLAGYATESYVADYFATNYTPPDLSSYASRYYADEAASNAQATAIAAIPSLAGYATESYVADYFATNYTPPDLSSYASRSYADEAASNAQATAIAAIPSLAGYATESYVADYFATNYTPPDLSSYASRSYADEAASNAQATAIAAIPSLAGYATESYAQSAAADAASDALSAAQSYARDLSWGAAQGNTRLVSLDGTLWQDATGVVWKIEGVIGWRGTIWTNGQAYATASTGVTQTVVFYPGPQDSAGFTTYTNGIFGRIFYDSAMSNALVWETPGSNYIYNQSGSGPTNIFAISADEVDTGFWASLDLTLGAVAESTNAIDRVLYESDAGDAATADRAATIGTETHWTDATGCVWEVGAPEWRSTTDGAEFHEWTEITYGDYAGMWDLSFSVYGDSSHVYTNAPSLHQSITVPAGAWWYHDDMEERGAFPVTFVLASTTNLVGRVALTNDLPDTAAIQEDIDGIRTESQLVYRLYSGSNVVAEVTNYNSQVHAPALRLMQLNESNEYVTVWTETKGLARTLCDATNYAASAIADYAAPRAWSRTTSGLGADAPANTTWISTPTTVIAGGFEYAKFVDTYGEVWVLSSNGMAAEFNPDTNAYFRITADDGTPVFSVEKTDAQLVGANSAGVTVGESTITIPVPVVSSTAPTMYWRSSLSSGDWADESAVNPNFMSVAWTGGPGSWVCTISFDGSRPPMMFFKFNFLQEGAVVIRNNATTDLSSGILVNGTKFVPSVSGNNLIWTKQ